MAQTTDLYPILKAYANKKKSPYISIEEFLSFLESYSARQAPEHPEWRKWAGETGVKFWGEMSGLVESEKCILMAEGPDGRIYMPYYYMELLTETYHSIDDSTDIPFPDEESLRITIPESQIKILHLETGLEPFFSGPRDETGIPVSLSTHGGKNGEGAHASSLPAIVKLIFPEGLGSALIPAPMIPKRLMESALLKIRRYLRVHSNQEYALHKLSPSLQGREKQLREILDEISIRPLDCLTDMQSHSEFAWLFWGHFCALVKSDIKKKREILAEDLAAVQAVFVIETCCILYKARAVKQREREIAFRSLELRMEKPPYHYTLDEICKFTNDKGVSLIGMYTPEELDGYIKKQIVESKTGGIPDWLILQGKKGERWYIKKEKMLPLCTKLIADTRPFIKNEISKRWTRLIKAFRAEAAMDKDADFDKLLTSYTAVLCPALTALLADTKLQYVYEEMEQTKKIIPPSSRIYKSGLLLPMSALYAVRRKELLADARLMLPFWYSVPILASIAAFFKRLGKKRRKKEQAGEDLLLEEETEDGGPEDIQNIARSIAGELVPPGQKLDDYLASLENRWSRLLNKQNRQNLVEDVNSLVRDKLRHTMRIQKNKKLSSQDLNEMAAELAARTPALRSLGEQDSLLLYMELYMVKLLLAFRL
ncbi:MAG: hypothetical protein LBO65_01400 [Spirochaetaceae bacterium]|jgi:hypothetical protein|nr:hypothetical protein [Spirochaetaceae bacterium]